uniref:Uncharacterized protein n=1 Tax=Arthrobacter sp. Chr15 TaxID=447032 RepID=A6YFV1_9MICC|nr:unknown [Arthrobacter sp. Chr15]
MRRCSAACRRRISACSKALRWSGERIGSPSTVQAFKRLSTQPRSRWVCFVIGTPSWGQSVPSGFLLKALRTSETVHPSTSQGRRTLARSFLDNGRRAKHWARISSAAAQRCPRRFVVL